MTARVQSVYEQLQKINEEISLATTQGDTSLVESLLLKKQQLMKQLQEVNETATSSTLLKG